MFDRKDVAKFRLDAMYVRCIDERAYFSEGKKNEMMSVYFSTVAKLVHFGIIRKIHLYHTC